MTEDQAVAAFRKAVETGLAEQANGGVGSAWIARAKIYYERLAQFGAQARVNDISRSYRLLIDQESARRKGKYQRSKQNKGTAELEEFERERTGQ